MKTRFTVYGWAVCALLFGMSMIQAAQVSWINPAGGNWGVATNWSLGTVPGSDDRAIINLDGNYTVTLNVNATVAGLELGGAGSGQPMLAITASARTLTLNGSSRIAEGGRLQLTAGTLTGTGDLDIAGELDWRGGTLSGSGTTRIESDGAIKTSGNSTKTLNGRTLRNQGWFQLDGAGALTLSGNSLLENEAAGLFEVLSDANVTSSGTPRSTLRNSGIFRRTSGNGTINVSAAFPNEGQVEILSGLVQLSGTGTATGSFHVAGNTTLRISADYTLTSTGTISGAGRVEFTGGSTGVEGAYDISGGTTVSTGSTASVNFSGQVLAVGNPLTVTSGTANFGTTALALTDVTLSGGTLANAASIVIGGTVTWTSGALGGSGVVRIEPGASLDLSGNTSRSLVARTLDLEGTATWTGAGTVAMSGAATWNVSAGATLDVRGEPTLTTSGSPRSVLNVHGTLLRSTSLGVFRVGCDLNNEGTTRVTSGTLTLQGGGAGSGEFLGEAGTILRYAAAYDLTSGSRIVSGGTVEFNSGTLVVPGVYEVTGATLVSGATVSFTGSNPVLGDALTVSSGSCNLADASVSLSHVTLSSGTLSGTGLLTINERMAWTTGTMSGSGTTLIAPGAVLALSAGSRTLSARTLSVAGGGTWGGTGTTTLNSQATFQVEAGGMLELQGDATLGGSGSPAPTFVNRGTVVRNTGAGTFTLSAPVTQSGRMEVRTGTLRFASALVQTEGALILAGGALTTTTFLDLRGGVLTGSGTVNGAIRNAATIVPGSSPGVIEVFGTAGWTNAPEGTIVIDLAGVNPGAEHDQLAASGRAALAGTMDVRLPEGYLPGVGDRFEVLRFGSVSGNFASYLGLALTSTLYLRPVLSSTNLVLEAVEPPRPRFFAPELTSGGGVLRLRMTEVAGLNVVVDASENLVDWSPVITNVNSPPILELLIDLDVETYPSRFYRSRLE